MVAMVAVASESAEDELQTSLSSLASMRVCRNHLTLGLFSEGVRQSLSCGWSLVESLDAVAVDTADTADNGQYRKLRHEHITSGWSGHQAQMKGPNSQRWGG
jgi:hypothetical protein